jgi:hypothetical protein
MKIKNLIKFFKENYNLEEECAYSLWTKEDIKTALDDYNSDNGLKIKLTNKQINDILIKIDSNLDANNGITWEILSNEVENYIHDFIYLKEK